MGEAKRRQEKLGDAYGQSKRILPWLPLTQKQSSQFVELTTKGAWVGIGLMVTLWLVVRFLGPTLGWWTVQG